MWRLPILFCLWLHLLAGAAVAAAAAGEADKVKTATVPERRLPEPEPRGKPYPVPATKWEQRPVLWGWTCELPDGSGLAFGGIHQTAGDGNPHTSIKEGGAWKPIVEELRQSNPLQKYFGRVRDLRDACKDTLAHARHIYFEGKTADEEAKLIKADVDPAVEKLAQDLARLTAELKGLAGLSNYGAGQVKFALQHLAAALQIRPFAAQVSPGQMAAMRCAQIELEIAAEAFDAEPAPRALSRIAFDPKTRLYAIFGGDHFDYLTNDLWVFDPAKRRWLQRHPQAAPEPRGDHHFEPLGDGRIAMRGGYCHGSGYVHVGPARWIYDVEKNAWIADGRQEKTFLADTRSSDNWPPAAPERFMAGPRPDAAANEARLKDLPANAWVRLKTPVALGGRDWGTWVFDADRDMFYVWAGGHASYPGNDVARYHLATDRWEISDPIELPLGCIGTNEQYPSGFGFNLRPWVRKHVWNSQAYDARLRRMVMAGATDPKLDPYCYLYDPDKADWTSRHRLPEGMGNGAGNMQVRHTRHGMLAWYGDQVWLLEANTMEWKKIAVRGKMPGTAVDSCGLVYDPKRDRMLFATLGGYAHPYDGQIHALDLATFQVAPLNPAGMDGSKKWRFFPREVAYHPASDLFVWAQLLDRGGGAVANSLLAYDGANNRWVVVKTAGAGGQPFAADSVCSSIAYDAKRGLFWVGDASWNGGVWVMRFDSAKAKIEPLEDAIAPRAGARLSRAEPTQSPLVRVVDLSRGESTEVGLCDGMKVQVKLLDLKETRDSIRDAVRSARVQVEIDGRKVWLASANYNLPVVVGKVQIDCPITKGTTTNSNGDHWGLEKEARLRLWPAGSPLFLPGKLVYPVKQRWFVSATQMANEPVYVDAAENPQVRKIYYHYGLDFGGAEIMTEVVAATDGLVVSAGKAVLPGYADTPVAPRYDVVYLLDAQGWYYRYSHLHSIAEGVRAGVKVKAGQRLGLLGKEGGSGGWSHLHFDIFCRQPSGKWGCQEAYAFVWEAYRKQYDPKLVAVARPHHFVAAGETAVLDGGRSWSADGKIVSYQWTFSDGATAEGARVQRKYAQPGYYSEILKVTDAAGRSNYDFAIVVVAERDHPQRLPPAMHVAYQPTFALHAGDAVTFKARMFGTTQGEETWDFGDGAPKATTRSNGSAEQHAKDGYATIMHRYERPGHYLVRVERKDGRGWPAIGCVYVPVGTDTK